MALHASVVRFIRDALVANRDLDIRRVIEFGSCMMHDHDPRPFFSGAEYIGVDWRNGKGVQVVGMTHEIDLGPADVLISFDALEHDPYWQQTISNAVYHLREGGLFLLTCAGPRMKPHELFCAPPDELGRSNYYNRELTPQRLAKAVQAALNTHGLQLQRPMEPHYRFVNNAWDRPCIAARIAPA